MQLIQSFGFMPLCYWYVGVVPFKACIIHICIAFSKLVAITSTCTRMLCDVYPWNSVYYVETI